MSERTSRKLFYFFCIKVKSIYKLRYIVFPNLQHPSLFYKNLRSAADKFTHSAVFTNTYTYTTLLSVSSLDITWSTLLKSYFVWNIYLFFLHQRLRALFYKNNFVEIEPLKHEFQNKLLWKYKNILTCGNSFCNITGYKKRGLAEKFHENIIAKVSFFKLWSRNPPRSLTSNTSNISLNSSSLLSLFWFKSYF